MDVCLGLCDSEWCSEALRNTFTGERESVCDNVNRMCDTLSEKERMLRPTQE